MLCRCCCCCQTAFWSSDISLQEKSKEVCSRSNPVHVRHCLDTRVLCLVRQSDLTKKRGVIGYNKKLFLGWHKKNSHKIQCHFYWGMMGVSLSFGIGAVLWLPLLVQFSRSRAMWLPSLSHQGDAASALCTRMLILGAWSLDVQPPWDGLLWGSEAMWKNSMQVRCLPQMSPTSESSQNLQIIPFPSCWVAFSSLNLPNWASNIKKQNQAIPTVPWIPDPQIPWA